MPADPPPPASATRSRPITRSSIRSLGKALADVMHKDKDTKEKSPVTNKENAAKRSSAFVRRTSAVNLTQPARPSVDKPALRKADRDVTPASALKEKTIARHSKRLSTIKRPATTSSDEQSASPLVTSKSVVGRAASLSRPRGSTASSALPKYRPRSLLVDPSTAKRTPSPRAPSRPSDSSETDDAPKDKGNLDNAYRQPSLTKASRPISPLPLRGALKVNLTSAINVRPSTPENKAKNPSPTPSPRHASSRPIKAAKTSAEQTTARGTVVPRRPSPSSSSTSPRTPKTPTGLNVAHGKAATTGSSREGSPLRGTVRAAPESPLGRLSKSMKGSPTSTLRGSAPSTPTPPSVTCSEGDSQDSIEANDVEFMLSTVISPTAPTPVLPRFRTTLAPAIELDSPQTPTHSPFLPARANLSYMSPTLPIADGSPFLRPPTLHTGVDRGSILSWEQLARHSQTLDDEDVENMLSQVSAPFDPAALASPAPALLDIPESPSLSALPSPTGFGAISQVLLPDVTPSPALHATTLRFHQEPDASLADAASLTLLRLQLASAESKAQEHRAAVELLEGQLRAAADARRRDTEALAAQVAELEAQVHGNLRADDQRAEYIGALEGQLRQAHAEREQAVQDALAQMQASAQVEAQKAVGAVHARWEAACAAREAGVAWAAVRDTAEGELELIRANRETLAVLLAVLDHS